MPHIFSCCDAVEEETMVIELKTERENLFMDKLDVEEGRITSYEVEKLMNTNPNKKKDTMKPVKKEEPKKVEKRMDMNHYATKKSAAQSMLDVALLMANSSQLKTVLYVGPQYRFYIPLVVLLSLSITLQVIVGLLLVFIVTLDLNDERKHKRLNKMNNAATVFVFFTVLINIFITALGFEGHVLSSFETPGMSIKEPNLSILPGDINTTGLTLF
ncbi:ninjurin-2 isoform X1 [Sebastes umbrosus]|uniref:ninjurin-2 isoform X1 n=1 Tax=Sebastes umbrosus TaxID=72105 RepID=UPI0018A09BE0|nr:ninjurin-2 isoform X1 [Sebastes umbrosus]